MSTQTNNRPFGVSVLSIAAWVAAFLAFVHVLQSLGILPFFIGRFLTLEGFNLWSGINGLGLGLGLGRADALES